MSSLAQEPEEEPKREGDQEGGRQTVELCSIRATEKNTQNANN